MTPEQREIRNRQMAEMRKAGATYTEIGERYGMTRQGVHAIIVREHPELVKRNPCRLYGSQ